VLASHYRGKRLNSPNDIVCKSDGSIWFSDPRYGINTDYEGGKQQPELPPTLYRLDPTTGELVIVADDFEGPNGLAFSPDESMLYVAESGRQFERHPRQYIRRFKVTGDNRLSDGAQFHKVLPGFADGLRVDEQGNVWSSAADGVHCISPDGELLGRILTPAPVANLTFGGRSQSRLFICASSTLMAIYTNVRGCERP
jgi:gluconolactonase